VGERANTMLRLFNCREGFTPQRLREGIGNGAPQGQCTTRRTRCTDPSRQRG